MKNKLYLKFIEILHFKLLSDVHSTRLPSCPPNLPIYPLPLTKIPALMEKSLGSKGGAGEQGVGYGDPIAKQPRDEYLNRVGAKRDTVSIGLMSTPFNTTAFNPRALPAPS